MRRGVLLSLAILHGGMASSISAQNAPWFGVPTPQQRAAERDRLISSGELQPLRIGPLALVAPPDDRYGDIRADELIAWVREIVHFSELSRARGDILWGRIMGTPFTDRAAEHMARRFRELGADRVWVEELPRGPQWWPTHVRLILRGDRAYGSGTEDCVLASALPAPPSPEIPGGVLEAEAVYVGNGRAADRLGRDLKGRIAVMRSRPSPGVLFHSGRGVPEELFAAGAAAVVVIFDDPGNHQYVPPLSSESQRGPTFTVGGDDGDFLEAVIGKAGTARPVRLRMELRAEVKRGWKVKNVFAQIEGQTDEYIVAIAHLDGFFEGAVDNASGLATLLAWARHFTAREESPRRNLLLVATAGHHAGSPGTVSLVEDHPDLLARTVLAINCEHTATIARTRYSNPLAELDRRGREVLPVADIPLPTNTESPRSLALSRPSRFLLEVVRQAIGRYGLVVYSVTDHRVRGDAGPLGARTSVPVLNFIESDYWYHHSGDTVEVLSPEGMERVARAFAWVIDRVDAAPTGEILGGR